MMWFITGIVGVATGSSSFNRLDVSGDSFTSNVSFSSSISLGNNNNRFGTSDDLVIYSDGTTSYIESGAGSFILKPVLFRLKS